MARVGDRLSDGLWVRWGKGTVGTVAVLVGVVALGSMSLVGAAAQSPALILTPAGVDFGVAEVGETLAQVITATNDTDDPLSLGAIVVEGDMLSKADDSCQDSTLDPGGECEVRVTFNPTSEGEFSGVVEFEVLGADTEIAGLFGVGVVSSSSTTTSDPPPTTSVSTTSPTSVPASTTTSTPLPASDRERLAQCEQRAASATVRFAPALEMTVGEAERFVAVASVEDDVTATSTDTPTTVASVALRCEVQAQLRGKDFEIDPGDFQPGSFLDRPTITWSWDVTAEKTGERTLTLEIRSIAVIEGRRIEGAGGELFTSTIQIDARPEGLWARSKRWFAEIVDHPLVRGLSSLLVVAATLAAVWGWLLKRPWPWARPHPATEADEDGEDFEGTDGDV